MKARRRLPGREEEETAGVQDRGMEQFMCREPPQECEVLGVWSVTHGESWGKGCGVLPHGP